MLQGPVSRNAARSRPGWFRLAWLQLPYCIRPASLLPNLPACHVCSSAGQTLWNGVTVVQQTHPALCEARRHVGVCKHILDHFCYPFQSSTLFPITFNQGCDSLTVALSPCLSILPWSVLTCPLLQCLFFFSLSLCRFTLTYRELILLFLSFNKLLSKRWDFLPWYTHHLSQQGSPPLPILLEK